MTGLYSLVISSLSRRFVLLVLRASLENHPFFIYPSTNNKQIIDKLTILDSVISGKHFKFVPPTSYTVSIHYIIDLKKTLVVNIFDYFCFLLEISFFLFKY